MTETGIALRFLDRITTAKDLAELQRVRDDVVKAELSALARQRVEGALVRRTEVLMDAIASKAEKVFPVDKPTPLRTPVPPAPPVAPVAPVDRPAIVTRSTEGLELVVPIATPAQARAAWDAYVALAQALEDPADVVEIEGHKWRRKSFWRKIANAYGVSVQELGEERRLETQPSGEVRIAFYVRTRATAASGRFMDGVGSCSSLERKGERKEHDVYATAYTRAANRAIADLVAAGEVSAEEVE